MVRGAPWILLLLGLAILIAATIFTLGPDPEHVTPRPVRDESREPVPRGEPGDPSRPPPGETPPGEPAPAPTFSGRVVDEKGQPIEGVKISWFRGPTVRTGEDGKFTIPVPGERSVRLRVDHRAHLLLRPRVRFPSDPLEFVLEKGLSITGRVTGHTGEPVEGVWVRAGRPRARSGPDGFYAITGLKEGEVSVQCLRSGVRIPGEDGEELRGHLTVRKAWAGERHVDFTVGGRPVELEIVDEAGRPFPGADVAIVASAGSPDRRFGTSGRDGRILTLLPWAKSITICVTAPEREPVTLVLTPEPDPARIYRVIALCRPGLPAAIAVTVRDERGDPLPVVLVTLVNAAGRPLPDHRDRRVDLDADGSGLLEGVPPGGYTLTLSTAGYEDSEEGFGLRTRTPVDLARGETTFVMSTVSMGGRIRVTVRDAEGEPARAGQVQLRSLETRRFTGIRFGLRTGAGKGEILSLAPVPVGEYEVIVRWPTKSQASARVTVERKKVTEVTIRLPR